MPTENQRLLSRRALLAAAPFVPSLLLAGCGGVGNGSESRPEDALPEGYTEAHSVNVSEGEPRYETRAIVAPPDGGVLIWQATTADRHDGDVLFRMVRYTNGATPGASERSEPMPPRLVNARLTYRFTIGASRATGKMYATRIETGALPTDVLGGSESLIFDALNTAGVSEGVVTLDTKPFYVHSGLSKSLAVAPNGDFFRASGSSTRGRGTLWSDHLLHWTADGTFIGGHYGTVDDTLTGLSVFFTPDGVASTLLYNEKTDVVRVARLHEPDALFVPLALPAPIIPWYDEQYRDGNIQTDATGNFYLSTLHAPTGSVTRAARRGYIRKFSLTGAELAAVPYPVDNEAGNPFAVASDGTVFVSNGTQLRVFRRTR